MTTTLSRIDSTFGTDVSLTNKSIKWWSPFQLVVLHFHTWHRACRQLPKANFRLMFKLMFTRATAPQPSPGRPWLSNMRSSGTLAAVEGSVACWLSGSASTRHGNLSPQARRALREQLCSGQTERLRMDAACKSSRSFCRLFFRSNT